MVYYAGDNFSIAVRVNTGDPALRLKEPSSVVLIFATPHAAEAQGSARLSGLDSLMDAKARIVQAQDRDGVTATYQISGTIAPPVYSGPRQVAQLILYNIVNIEESSIPQVKIADSKGDFYTAALQSGPEFLVGTQVDRPQACLPIPAGALEIMPVAGHPLIFSTTRA